MIKQNLGFIERMIRFVLGVIVALWVLNQPDMGILEWIAAVCALFLTLNAIFGRCYLWFWFNLDSCDESLGDECGRKSTCD
ncbi:YgaP family membrane protein [Oceanicoccus sagamiensis]|uniref:Inner membrane protein YgaP-like transmembrane domain-containing protein n=1 Tax=Oceanicoccus sagamiensis TaxID=716816 RepID=A0A1X9N8W0_9GAMM|nr:DUF2892 domain-containing protein [Oceanicoccus sagamiensis]ARN74106.1 hypothetical protein BST96_08210 [Oceanicoccus sagamiensis]